MGEWVMGTADGRWQMADDSNLPLCAQGASSSEGLSPEFTRISAWDLNHNRGPASPSDYFKAPLGDAVTGLPRKLRKTARRSGVQSRKCAVNPLMGASLRALAEEGIWTRGPSQK
jgi:hypothetical protein